VLLDRDAGPKAGNLLAFLDPGFVVPRLRELPLDRVTFWRESSVTTEQLEKWIEQHREKITSKSSTTAMEGSVAVFEITFALSDCKRHLKRLLVEGQPADRATQGLLARLQVSPSGTEGAG
jgi:hypothetical protein